MKQQARAPSTAAAGVRPRSVAPSPRQLPDLRANLISGFLVCLIALPLSLGIALASGFPPIAGVLTAIVGGLVTPFLSPSALTIKGPAAGLIVVVLGCVTDFGGTGLADGSWSTADQSAYEMTLGVACVAALFQVLFARGKCGAVTALIPSSAIHGMLCAIGILVMAKQVPAVVGAPSRGGVFELLAHTPELLAAANPRVALIGLGSLLILFQWPRLAGNSILRRVPAPLAVVLVSIPGAHVLGFTAESPQQYTLGGASYEASRRFLVSLPSNVLESLALPNFSALTSGKAWYWIAMFSLIGSLESMLSARAVDKLDPERRVTALDRDLLSVGVGNLLAAALGGLPMISEIVRSRANIDSGARGRHANLFHGLFLLALLVALPGVLSLIPLSALGAILVYTGSRLAHPRELANAYTIGPGQLVVFASTTMAVLLTDLLVGIAVGVGAELTLNALSGAPLRAWLKPRVDVHMVDEQHVVVRLRDAAVFSNWLGVRAALLRATTRHVTIDLSMARVVDPTVMERLHQLALELDCSARHFVITGLARHEPASAHPFAARRLRAADLRA